MLMSIMNETLINHAICGQIVSVKSARKLTMLLMMLIIILCLLTGESTAESDRKTRKCKANKDKFYEESAQDGRKIRCSNCPRCNHGEGRVYTKQYKAKIRRGQYGDIDCYPCIPCTSGYFNNGRSRSCMSCAKDCRTMNRMVHQECTPFSDAICGSCITGFSDDHQDLHYPCVKIQARIPAYSDTPATTVPSSPSSSVSHINSNVTVPLGPTAWSTVVTGNWNKPKQQQQQQSSTQAIPVSGILVLVGFVLVLVLTVVKTCIYSRGRRRKKHHVFPQPEENLGQECSSKQKMISGVLEADSCVFQTPEQNPELDHPQFRKFSNLQGGGNRNQMEIDTNTKLSKSDKYITFVATNLNPPESETALFADLGLLPPEYTPHHYLYGNDKITYREYLIRALNRWTEVKGKEATLQALCSALTKSGQGGMVTEIMNMHDKN